MDGILNIYKPSGPTSHDVVAQVRRLLRLRRVGHAGTLDPAAEGVLLLFVGRATRFIQFLSDADKEYIGEVLFGVATTTLDSQGEVTATADASSLTSQQVAALLPRFVGEIEQLAPMYSAVHYQGQRLYELARRGEEVERKPRRVTVHTLEILDFTPGPKARARLRIVCSKGTYIRSLAADLGAALGFPAHLAALIRTRIGPFTLQDALPLDQLAAWVAQREQTPNRGEPVWQRYLWPTRTAVAHLPVVVLSGERLERIRHGNWVPLSSPPPETLVRIETPEGEWIGVGRCTQVAGQWRLHPEKMLPG